MRVKKQLTPDQIRLKELEKIIKRDSKRFLSFITAAGEIKHKRLHRLTHINFYEYLYYKCNIDLHLSKEIEIGIVDYYEKIAKIPIAETRFHIEVVSKMK